MTKKINKSLMLRIRVTPSEKELIRRYAEAVHLDVSNYLRLLALQAFSAPKEGYKVKSATYEEINVPMVQKRKHAG